MDNQMSDVILKLSCNDYQRLLKVIENDEKNRTNARERYREQNGKKGIKEVPLGPIKFTVMNMISRKVKLRISNKIYCEKTPATPVTDEKMKFEEELQNRFELLQGKQDDSIDQFKTKEHLDLKKIFSEMGGNMTNEKETGVTKDDLRSAIEVLEKLNHLNSETVKTSFSNGSVNIIINNVNISK